MIINQRIELNNIVSEKKSKSLLTNVFDCLFVVGLFAFLSYSFVYSFDKVKYFPIEYMLLCVNGVVSIYGQLISIRKNSSIHFMSFVFCYFFMSIAPIVQLGFANDPIFKMDYMALSAVSSAVLFTVIGIFFTVRVKCSGNAGIRKTPINGHYFALFFLLLTVSLFAIILFWDGLFTSRQGFGYTLGRIFPNGPTALLAYNFLMLVPVFGTAIGLRASLENRRYGWTFLYLILLLFAAVINNPLINPRFRLAGLALYFIDYFFSGKKLRLLVVVVMLGIAIAPLFHFFRLGKQNIYVEHKKEQFSDTFLSYDYDAFQIACYTVLTVEQRGITWGANIAGALLGFVPRVWWEGKPRQTSYIIYETMIKHRKVGTENLSTPLMAEGYFAFSWVGVFLISLFYWSLSSKLFVVSLHNSNTLSFLFRCIFAGLVLIFLRGTLIVAVPVVLGAFVAGIIPWSVFWYGKRPFLSDTKP